WHHVTSVFLSRVSSQLTQEDTQAAGSPASGVFPILETAVPHFVRRNPRVRPGPNPCRSLPSFFLSRSHRMSAEERSQIKVLSESGLGAAWSRPCLGRSGLLVRIQSPGQKHQGAFRRHG